MPRRRRSRAARDSVELAMKLGYQAPQSGPVRGVLVATEQSGSGTDHGSHRDRRDVSRRCRAARRRRRRPARFGRWLRPRYRRRLDRHPTLPRLPVLVLFAVLGGLILNLMPCVFPVLSIKAIGLVEQAKKHPAAVRTKGFVFAAGVISSMLALAAVLLAAARRRRADRLGFPAAIAAVRHADDLSAAGGGA